MNARTAAIAVVALAVDVAAGWQLNRTEVVVEGDSAPVTMAVVPDRKGGRIRRGRSR